MNRVIKSWKSKKKTGAMRKKIQTAYYNIKNSVQSSSIGSDAIHPNQSNNNEEGSVSQIVECDQFQHINQISTAEQDNINMLLVQDQTHILDNRQEFNINAEEYFNSLPQSSSEDSDEECPNEYFSNKNLQFRNNLQTWAVQKNISHASFKELIVIVNNRFGNILPCDPRTILHTPKTRSIKTMEGGDYWHHGIKHSLNEILVNWDTLPDQIELNINIDGLPIYKSAKKEFWPILANIHKCEINPFIIGIYFGAGKPKNLDFFLDDFVSEMSEVQRQGIYVKGINISVKIRCFICDSPARAFIKGKGFET